jgi:hypothetical protein
MRNGGFGSRSLVRYGGGERLTAEGSLRTTKMHQARRARRSSSP